MKKIVLILALALLPVILFSQVEIKMEESGGVYYVPCKVNGLPLKLIFDTGASDVSISATEAVFMLKNGYLSSEDMHGTTYSSIANGDIVEGTEITIKEIEIGGITIKNVSASVVHSLSAPLLIGQSAIQKLGPIHLNGNILTIENGLKLKSNKEATLLYGKVFQYIEAEEYDNAIETAIKAIDIAEDNMIKAVLYGELGNAYKGKGQLEAAAEACRTALTFYPYKSAAYNLGIYLNDLEKYEQAYKAFKQYLTLQAGMPENDDDEFLAGAYATMGVIDYKRGRYVDAESNCKKSLKYSEHSLPYLTLGDIYKQQEKYNDAVACYDKGIRFEPERPSNIIRLIDLSDCYMKLNDFENSIHCCLYAEHLFVEVVDAVGFDSLTEEIAASGIMVTEMLAQMHIRAGLYTVAIEMYEYVRGLKVPMKESNYVYLAFCYHKNGDYAKEAKTIKDGIQYYPNNGDLLFHSIEQQPTQEAINGYMKILENEKTYTPIFFDYASVYNNIAYIYCLLGEYNKGLEYAQKAIARNPDDGHAWDTLGELYYRQNKYEDCVSAMTKAISLHPIKNSYQLRGEAYLKLGNKKQGDKDLKIAMEMK